MRGTKRALLTVVVLLSGYNNLFSQVSCENNKGESWEWPGHNNWFLPKWAPSDGRSAIFNQSTGATTWVRQTDWNAPNTQTTSVRGYQGIAAASDDAGNLIFFTNGRKAWAADGTLLTDQILQGNECGSVEDRGSAVHGCMIVRHPLEPRYFYILTIDDIVNQGCPNNGITVARIDVPAGGGTPSLGYASRAIETQITSGQEGKFRTTESMAATFHGNGTDIWITFQPLDKDYYVSYLLTCEGFVTPPVPSAAGMCTPTDIMLGNGDIDFNPDGTMMAAGVHVNQAAPSAAPLYGYGTLNLYDFNNITGEITNRKAVFPQQWGTNIVYNVLFSADGSKLHYSGQSGNGMVDVTGNQAAIRASHTGSNALSGGWEGAAMNAQGQIEARNQTNAKAGVSGPNEFGANDMYIPPLEQPTIQDPIPMCDTSEVFDFDTYWKFCDRNGDAVLAEDTLTPMPQRVPWTYSIVQGNAAALIDDTLGLFDPKIGGSGIYQIRYDKCGVWDTLTFEVTECGSCIDTLLNISPAICAGNTYGLEALIDTANGPGVWSIISMPAGTGSANVDATIDDTVADTLFDASDLNTKNGVYEVMYTVTKDGALCYDTVTITVNTNPIISVNDAVICDGEPAANFAATSDSTASDYLWSINGTGTAGATSGTAAGDYAVEVTDANGCVGRDTGTLVVNALPVIAVNNDTICIGDPDATFTATSDSTVSMYAWTDNGSGVAQTTTGSTAGNYSVEVTDVNGCIGRDTGVLIVNALPVVSVNSDTICDGDAAVTFTATSDSTVATYAWTGNGTGDQQTTSGNTAGDYIVGIVDVNGCLGGAMGTLLVNALPVVSVNSDTICDGGLNATFVATVDSVVDTYTWSENGSGNAQSFNGNTAGNYTVDIVDVNGCAGQATGVLTVNTNPVVTVNDAEICDGGAAATFTATSDSTPDTFAWSENGTGTAVSATGTTAGNYTVTVTDVNGCIGSGTGVLTVHDNPVVTLLGGTICPGMTQTLSPQVTGGAAPDTYAWSTGATTPTINEGNAGNYSVTITDINGCEGTDDADIIVDANLDVQFAVPHHDICDGESVNLISNYLAVDGYNFTWSNAGSGTNENFNANATGTYELYVDNGLGCDGTGQVTVTVREIPQVGNQGADICEGNPATIGENVTGPDTYSYEWTHDPTETGFSITVTTGGSYTRNVESNFGCTNNSTYVVNESLNPIVSIADREACENNANGITLTAVINAHGSTYDVLWSDAGGSTTEEINPTSTGTFTATVTTAEGCIGSDQGTATYIQVPIIDMGPDITVCEGTPVTITPNHNGDMLLWQQPQGATGSSITVVDSGMYIALTGNALCLSSDTMIVNVVPYPESQIDHLLAANPICFEELALAGDSGLVLLANVDSNLTYSWSTGDTTNSIIVKEEGTYDVDITVGGDCPVSDQITFIDFCPWTLFVPNAFTPDGNHTNDWFGARGTNILEYEMLIYDRWGIQVYQSNDLNNMWDGKYKGNDAQMDVYVWVINFRVETSAGKEEDFRRVGTVSLVR